MEAENYDSDASERPHALAVDDEVTIHGVLERIFPREGIQVTTCSSGTDALELIDEHDFDVLLADAQMPEMGGMELVERVSEEYPHLDIVLLSTQGNVQQAVRAMQKGAADYIPKPFSTDELVDRVKSGRASSHENEQDEEEEPTDETDKSEEKPSGRPAYDADVPQFVGEHQCVEKLRSMVDRIAGSKAPVFVQGESGTGKEILSRLIHEKSNRSDQAYVPVNCAALPSELVESHLFGHVEGAFTGAVDDMTGAFEKADGGTLLLDEITEIDPSIQAKLLRVLQTGEFQKVGCSDKQSADVRVIATSNRDLEEAVEEGTFREDLYHRLSVFPLHTPPLRSRLSDIPLLAEHFIEKYAVQYDLPVKTIAPDLLQLFQSYAWPGNVRELENVIHRGMIMADERDCIEKEDVYDLFSAEQGSNDGDASLGQNGAAIAEMTADGSPPTIAEMERKLILNTLANSDLSQKEAAEELGVSPRTIRNKLQEYREQGFSI
ncbi:MAG: sigma-54-dependent Fis family transcriptional regulator [Bacteroidetes bacterium QH_7_62_13]|nr:MAG: sigma-54-dependent Fis family transcriptional regulator [Bacteroidetes bacterium QH_7_62_13]